MRKRRRKKKPEEAERKPTYFSEEKLIWQLDHCI
jgi:hypothetical protein